MENRMIYTYVCVCERTVQRDEEGKQKEE